MIGVPDDKWGERPRDIVILDELPRTSTGKVRKNTLREQAWADKEAHIN